MQDWDDHVNHSEEAHEIDHLIAHPRIAVARFPFRSLGCFQCWINCFAYYKLKILGFLIIPFVFGVIMCVTCLPATLIQPEMHQRTVALLEPHIGQQKCILPRQTHTLTDFGSPTRFRDWLDIQKQGEPNDYVRYVGPTKVYSFQWLAVAFAGSFEQYTPPGLYEEHGGIVIRTSIKLRQNIPDNNQLGLSEHFKGWVDVQNQGVPNDYAYYVPASEDIPFAWLTIALAGSSERRTCPWLYEEKYGRIQPTPLKEYYDENQISSCLRWTTIVRKFYASSLNDEPHRKNIMHSQSQVVNQNTIAIKSTSISILRTISQQRWRKLVPSDIEAVLGQYRNGSSSLSDLSCQFYTSVIILNILNILFLIKTLES